jgi:hypothetical protein
MRQWELFGITDSDPWWTPPKREDPPVIIQDPPERREERLHRPAPEVGRWTFFWSTDASLRMRTVSMAAADAIGVSAARLEGRELLDVLSFIGPELVALEAHAEALAGGVGNFSLRCPGGELRCRVAPTHGEDDRVIGTFCLAAIQPPLEDEPVAALAGAQAA